MGNLSNESVKIFQTLRQHLVLRAYNLALMSLREEGEKKKELHKIDRFPFLSSNLNMKIKKQNNKKTKTLPEQTRF